MAATEQFDTLDPRVSAAIDEAVGRLRSEIREELLQLLKGDSRDVGQVPAIEAPAPTPAAQPQPMSDAVDELKHAVSRLDRCGTQAVILDALCEEAHRFSSRSAIVLTRDNGLEFWSQCGFEAAPPEIKGLTIEGGAPGERFLDATGVLPLDSAQCASLCNALGAAPPTVALFLPFMVGDQVVAGLYADRLDGDGSLNLSALQILTFLAGQILENLPVRTRAETPTLKMANREASAPPAPVTAEPTPEPVPESGVPDADQLIEDAAGPPVERPTTVSDLLAESGSTDKTVADPSGFSPGFETTEIPPLGELGMADSTKLEEPQADAPAPPAATSATPEAPPAPSAAATSETTAFKASSDTQVRPPDDVKGPGWAFTATADEDASSDEVVHEEARRLARLLVTEIKLYNEDEVEGGRRESNLYNRLREDIDRSRQIYEERVASEVRDGTDYFKEALVRILGGGSEGALGQ